MKRIGTSGWIVPLLLLLLGGITVLFGALQLDSLLIQGPPEVADEFTSLLYFEQPIPIVLHIVAGIGLNLLAPFQFARPVLRRWPRFHRWSGRLVLVSGLLVALTGLWMNHVFPQYGGPLKYPGILINSLGLGMGLLIALQAIWQRDVARHRSWMMRAIAFGLGPATQRVVIIPLFLALGDLPDWVIGAVIWFGFSWNLAVVEWVLWRERRQPARRTAVSLGRQV